MRDLKVVGLDVDGRHILCEEDEATGTPSKFRLRVDDRLRAAVRGDAAQAGQTQIEVRSVLRPKEIQSRIRAGASVEQLAEASGVDPAKIERFAHPVLLERSRAAELATAAHPVLTDGPSVLTLLESVTTALVNRGLNPDSTTWDSWRNEDGRWTVQLAWKAGCSDNVAHFRYVPGAHGGTVTALDETATELIDPDFDRPLRPVARWRSWPSITRSQPRPRPHRHPSRPGPPRRPARPAPSGPGPRCPRGKTSCSGCAPAATAEALAQPPTANASSPSQPPATPTALPRTNQRTTGIRRQPHTVGANPPTATRFRPTASSGCTRIKPRLNTTIAAAMTAAAKAAAVSPVPQGVGSSVTVAP